MKRLLLSLCLAGLISPLAGAVSYTAGGSTYTYTEKSTQKLNSGVTHHRLRFTSPKTLNVQIVEVDLTDPNVRVETTLGSDKMFSAQSLVNRYNNLKTAGRKPLVIQNASFWAMSSQGNIIDQGKYAANSALGGIMQNGHIIGESNSALDSWVGGPTIHGVVAIGNNKATVGHYKTNIRLMCPTKWGGNENINVLSPTEVNKYCHYGTIAIFNQMFPNTREISVINSTNGQPGAKMTSSDATYVFLNLKSGQSEKYGEWVNYEIKDIKRNCCSATRGSYDLVVVFAIGAHSAVQALAVGDEMKMRYYWHPADQYDNATMTPLSGIENLVAGESLPMINGVVQSPSSYGATTYSRSAYGVSQDGKKLIMCIIDKSTDATYGTSSGCTTTVMSYIMQHWGAYNIVNCDAGGSAQMVINAKQVGTPSDSRGIVASVVVFDEGSTSTGGGEVINPPSTGDDPVTPSVNPVTPLEGSPNPFAYDVTGTFNADTKKLKVSYKLNTDAKAVSLEVYGDNQTSQTYNLSGKTKGSQSKTVDVSALPAGTYSWSINVEGKPVTAPTEFISVGFNHPQGIDIVRNTDDPYYGTLLITEGRPTTKDKHWSGTRGGQGIYLFDPQMNGIANPAGGYAFRGGLSDTNYSTSVGSAAKSGNIPRKLKISDDGRIFMTTQSSFAAPLYEIPSVSQLVNNANFTQVMGGPIWTDSNSENFYCWTDNNGNFSSAPNVGLAVTGSGANLRIALLGGKNAMWTSSTPSATTCHYYNLGNNKLWGGNAPSGTVNGLDGKYLVNYTGANLQYDNRGNLWFSQYRGTPSASQPSIVVVNPSGNEIYKDITTVLGGGGLAFNNDYTMVMHSSSASTFSVYDLSWDASGKPVLSERYRITHGMGTNVNDYAWDLAGNLYACGNTNEMLKGFAMPRESNSLETPARAQYNFTIEAAAGPNNDDNVDPLPDSVTVGIAGAFNNWSTTANVTSEIVDNCGSITINNWSNTKSGQTAGFKVIVTTNNNVVWYGASSVNADGWTTTSTDGNNMNLPSNCEGKDIRFTLAADNGHFAYEILNPDSDPEPDPEPDDFRSKIDKMTEVWEFSETLGNAGAPSVHPWAILSGGQTVRDLEFLNGKLYTANNSAAYTGVVVNAVNPANGKIIKSLNVTGISGGRLVLGGLSSIGGQLIASNSVANGSTLKIYKWTDDNSAPEIWFSGTNNTGITIGDQINTSGDLNDGYIWFSDATKVVKYKVSNGTVNDTPEVITLAGGAVGNAGMVDVAVMPNGKFWVSGAQSMTSLYNPDGSLVGTLNIELPAEFAATKSLKQGTAVAHIPFGSRTYLAMTTYLSTAETISKGCVAIVDVTDALSGLGISRASTINGELVGLYPEDGFGTTRNTQFETGVTYQLTNDGTKLDVAGVVCMQGVNMLCYDGVGNTTEVDFIEVGNNVAPVFYNLQGVKVSGDNLTPGIYIKKQGDKTSKVLVK